MTAGRQRNQRSMIVMQAALVWSQADTDELREFIETGNWQGEASEVLPYNPQIRELVVKQFQQGIA